jgi:hypothetical protein
MAIVPLPASFPARRIAVVRRKDRLPGLLTTSLLKLLAEHLRGPSDER